jgi:hypothetical protein
VGLTTGLDRRAPGSTPLRAGALRCEDCGTTWFDQLAVHVVNAGRKCRRCGGTLHTERRKQAVAVRAA